MPGRELVSSAAKQPAKAAPIPAKVRLAIRYMTHGAGEDGSPMNVVEAAKAVGMQPWALRKHFDRPGTLAHLRRERRTVVELICAGNPHALRKVRDHAINSVAQVNSVKALEDMNSPEGQRQSGPEWSPRLTIVIKSADPAPAMQTVIEHDPQPASGSPPRYDHEGHLVEPHRDASGHRIGPDGQWCFDPDYRR
jgi:hypothetical protein